MNDRIPAITGMGVISSLDSTLEGHWQRMLQGETGIRELGAEDLPRALRYAGRASARGRSSRSEEHTSELQSR